jgi:hypothetical protein
VPERVRDLLIGIAVCVLEAENVKRRRCGDRRVGTEHLLLGILHDPATAAVLGVSLEQCRQALHSLDREALEFLGLTASLEAPSLPTRRVPARPTLQAVLKDRLPMTPGAKEALELAARPMRQGRHVNPQDVLLCLFDLKHPDPGRGLDRRAGHRCRSRKSAHVGCVKGSKHLGAAPCARSNLIHKATGIAQLLTGQQLRKKRLHLGVDGVSDGSNLVYRFTCWVGKLPIDVTLPWVNRT